MARRKKGKAYVAPVAPKVGKGKTKMFEVSPGCGVFDVAGKKCVGGEKAELTVSLANYLANRNQILVNLNFEDDGDDTSGEAGGSDEEVTSGPAKASDEGTSKSDGGKSDNGLGKSTSDAPKRKGSL